MYVANDKLNQNSSAITNYNLENNPISFTEDNHYSNNKTLSSTELEIKYTPNEKNYITNLFIFKNNSNKTTNISLHSDAETTNSSELRIVG